MEFLEEKVKGSTVQLRGAIRAVGEFDSRQASGHGVSAESRNARLAVRVAAPLYFLFHNTKM